jgi:hypothetical protein
MAPHRTSSLATVMTALTSLSIALGVLMTVMGQSKLSALAMQSGGSLETPWLWFLSPYVPIGVMAAIAMRSAKAAVVVFVGALAVALPAVKMMAYIMAVPAGTQPGHGALDAQFGLGLGVLPALQWFAAFVVAVVVGLVGLKRRAGSP